MDSEKVKKLDIPASPGCYEFLDAQGEIIYVGKAANLKSRVSSYWRESAGLTPAKQAMVREISAIKWIETDSEIEALLLESNLIKKHQPSFNVVLRDDKRFAYVKISLDDEIPAVSVTRKVDRSGKYYGPFVSASALRETLKTIRKIWPYCTERTYKKKPCFYYHINLCTGICGGLISRDEYMEEVIKPIMLFFEGKKKRIISGYEKELKALKKELKKHKEDEVRFAELEQKITRDEFRLLNIHRVLEHANILGIGEKYANDVVELAKILGLKKIPQRIEGYDIANIFGKEAVGSMVVFAEGEADKNEYRKFKIKIGQGRADDTRMLKEVLDRRLHNDWPLPDLIIIDGGKGQLNAALAVLKKNKKDIMAISISKGSGLRSAIAPDKLFFPGEKKALELPLASPALHLLKRVRDEAHRFAISYHRKLRGKNFLTK